MRPRPRTENAFRGAGRLRGRVALITGGDSGIGRAVAVAFAKEGADIGIVYLNEHRDARDTVRLVEAHERRAFRIAGDVGREAFCRAAVRRVVRRLGRLDILVNKPDRLREPTPGGPLAKASPEDQDVGRPAFR